MTMTRPALMADGLLGAHVQRIALSFGDSDVTTDEEDAILLEAGRRLCSSLPPVAGFVVIDDRRSASAKHPAPGADLTQLARRGGVAFRVDVHFDSHFDFQSKAVLQMWTPTGWTEVVRLHGPEVTDVSAAAAALYERATLVLDIATQVTDAPGWTAQ